MAQEEEILGKAYDSRLMRRLLRVLKPYRWGVAGAIALAIGTAALGPMRPKLTQIAIDQYIIPGAWDGLPWMLFLLGASLVLQAAAQYALAYVTQLVGQRAIFDIRMQVFEHMQTLALKFFDRNPVGRLVTRLTNDIEVLNDMFSSGVVMIFADVFVIIWIIAFMFSISWDLALVTLASLPLLIWGTSIFRRKVRETYRDVRVQVARMNTFMNEDVTGMTTVQLFHQEKRMFEQFRSINREHTDANVRSIFYYAVFFPGVEIISALTLMLILWYGGTHVLQHAMSVGTLIAFFQYTEMFFRPVRDLSEKYNVMQTAMASSERIFNVLDDQTIIDHPTEEIDVETMRGEITFNDVTFGYDPARPVLRNITFSVLPGQRIAFVGATGAGKTSITNLLCRFYEFQEGEIRIDGLDIRNIHARDIRRNIAVVMQDVFLFAGDIAANISLGDPSISLEQIKAAARAVGADKFIERLPLGYNEPVHERGVVLSSGQRQLIAFARALVRNPQILILDEATSNVDSESEMLIEQATATLLKDRTAIIIAHRLSTIQHADQIYVMHHGEIREHGTHQELLSQGGIYAKLHLLQYRVIV